jgi:hypothetical protein
VCVRLLVSLRVLTRACFLSLSCWLTEVRRRELRCLYLRCPDLPRPCFLSRSALCAPTASRTAWLASCYAPRSASCSITRATCSSRASTTTWSSRSSSQPGARARQGASRASTTTWSSRSSSQEQERGKALPGHQRRRGRHDRLARSKSAARRAAVTITYVASTYLGDRPHRRHVPLQGRQGLHHRGGGIVGDAPGVLQANFLPAHAS